jgi:hypothetical protein
MDRTIRLVFDVGEVATLVVLTEAATEHQGLQGRMVEPRLFLVKDEGVYLMSSAKGLAINPKTGTLPVAYAQGFDPRKASRRAVWEAGQKISGNDFSEFVPLEAVEPLLDACSEIYVVLTEQTMAVEGKPKVRLA